jgi:hypothetical protein
VGGWFIIASTFDGVKTVDDKISVMAGLLASSCYLKFQTDGIRPEDIAMVLVGYRPHPEDRHGWFVVVITMNECVMASSVDIRVAELPDLDIRQATGAIAEMVDRVCKGDESAAPYKTPEAMEEAINL